MYGIMIYLSCLCKSNSLRIFVHSFYLFYRIQTNLYQKDLSGSPMVLWCIMRFHNGSVMSLMLHTSSVRVLRLHDGCVMVPWCFMRLFMKGVWGSAMVLEVPYRLCEGFWGGMMVCIMILLWFHEVLWDYVVVPCKIHQEFLRFCNRIAKAW